MSSGNHQALILGVAGDIASTGAIIATFAGILPPVAALVAVLWYLLQIWESVTVQKWVKAHRHHERRKRRARRKVAEPPEIPHVQLS